MLDNKVKYTAAVFATCLAGYVLYSMYIQNTKCKEEEKKSLRNAVMDSLPLALASSGMFYMVYSLTNKPCNMLEDSSMATTSLPAPVQQPPMMQQQTPMPTAPPPPPQVSSNMMMRGYNSPKQ